MTKTGGQIQGDVYELLRNSRLAREISGKVYRDPEYRPRDSKKEDAVIIFTAGTADEVQEGVVTINIFVPDIDPDRNGTWVKSGRTEQIEALAQEWFDSLSAATSNYHLRLTQAIATDEMRETHQHFVVVRLGFKFYE